MLNRTRSQTLLASAPTIPLCHEDQRPDKELSDFELAELKAPTHTGLTPRARKAERIDSLSGTTCSDISIPPLFEFSENCRFGFPLVTSAAQTTLLAGGRADPEGVFDDDFLLRRILSAPIVSRAAAIQDEIVEDLEPHSAFLVSELATSAACLPLPTRHTVSQDLSGALRMAISPQHGDYPVNHDSPHALGFNKALMPRATVGHTCPLFTSRHKASGVSPGAKTRRKRLSCQKRMSTNTETNQRPEIPPHDEDDSDLWDPGTVFRALEGVAEKPVLDGQQSETQKTSPLQNLRQLALSSCGPTFLDDAVDSAARTRSTRVKRKFAASSTRATVRVPSPQLLLPNDLPCQNYLQSVQDVTFSKKEAQLGNSLVLAPAVKFVNAAKKQKKHGTKQQRRKSVEWSEDETQALRAIVAESGERDWTFIAKRIGTRNKAQCRQKWFGSMRPGLAKGAWTAAENAVLHKLAAATQKPCFNSLSKTVLCGRSVKQIQERWRNHFDPGTNFAPFTPVEIATLRSLRQQNFGWSYISKHLCERTPSQVCERIHFYVKLEEATDKFESSCTYSYFDICCWFCLGP